MTNVGKKDRVRYHSKGGEGFKGYKRRFTLLTSGSFKVFYFLLSLSLLCRLQVVLIQEGPAKQK